MKTRRRTRRKEGEGGIYSLFYRDELGRDGSRTRQGKTTQRNATQTQSIHNCYCDAGYRIQHGEGMGMGTKGMFIDGRSSNGSLSLVIGHCERYEPVTDPFDVYEIKCHGAYVATHFIFFLWLFGGCLVDIYDVHGIGMAQEGRAPCTPVVVCTAIQREPSPSR